MFWKNTTDAINRRNSQVEFTKREKICNWISNFRKNENMAVYGGSSKKRAAIISEAISRVYGKAGIVIIHNDPDLISELASFRSNYPRIVEMARDNGIKVPLYDISSNKTDYEPFYGMTDNRIVETIYPGNVGEVSGSIRSVYAAALDGCLRIIREMKMNVDLDSLLEITGKKPDELEQFFGIAQKNTGRLGRQTNDRIVSGNCDPEIAKAVHMLKTDDNYKQVRADVNTFARSLQDRIWHKKNSQEESRSISILESVEQKAILSIYGVDNVNVLNYLAAELNQLREEQKRFLLIIDSVSVGATNISSDILEQASLPFPVLLAADYIHSLYQNDESKMRTSIGKMNHMIIMSTADTDHAKFYTDGIGQYLRQFETTTSGTQRGAFQLFSGKSNGIGVTENLYDRIRPEELAKLGEGAVLIGQRDGGRLIVLTKDFDF